MASSVFNRDSSFRPNTPYNAGSGSSTATEPNPAPTTSYADYNPYGLNPTPPTQATPPNLANNAGTVMTFDNTMSKTIISFAVVLLTAAFGWFFLPPALMLPLIIAGLVVGLVTGLRKEPSKALTLSYSAIQGLLMGALSGILENIYPGIVSQATLATFTVIGVTLVLYRSGYVRSTPKLTKFFIIAGSAYLVFSLINLGLMATGLSDSAWGLHTSITIFGIPLGIILGIFAVLMGAYSLILDFDFVENGVKNKLPEKYGWKAAFGIVATVVWIYFELLRLISIFRS